MSKTVEVTKVPLTLIGREVEVHSSGEDGQPGTLILRTGQPEHDNHFALTRGDAVRIMAALGAHYMIMPKEISDSLEQLHSLDKG